MTIASQLEQILRARCRQNLPNVTAQMVTDTRAACPVQNGDLAASIQADDWAEQGDRYVSTISAGRGLPNPDVARFQDEGTGLYGPMGAMIVPLGNKPMTFYWEKVGGWRSLWEMRGTPGRHYFVEPMPQRFSEALRNNF